MTKKKATPEDAAPRLPVDQIETINGRLTLLNPITFDAMPEAWIEFAPVNSLEGDKASAAMIAKAKASTVDTTKLPDAEYLAFTYKQNRELSARLIVAWNEDYFGKLSVNRAIEIMESKRWISVQVDLFLKNTRNFYRA